MDQDKLIKAALEISKNAYAPYSKYKVGAALLSKEGRTFTGVNVENAAYPVTICAERTAVFKAVSEGVLDFLAIAVVTDDGGTPCGSCRQVLSEFGLDTLVLLVDKDGQIVLEQTVRELLPGAFTSDSLDL